VTASNPRLTTLSAETIRKQGKKAPLLNRTPPTSLKSIAGTLFRRSRIT
jgi:hypothetical protein